MKIRKLQLLEKAVREQPDDLFDMEQWGEEKPCGTAACSAGAFALRYPKQGLSLIGGRYKYIYATRNGDVTGFNACAFVFGLTERAADRLFSSGNYAIPDKSSVLRRIRSYIRKAERERARRKAVRA